MASILFVSSCSCEQNIIIDENGNQIDLSTRDYKEYSEFFLPKIEDMYSQKEEKYSVQIYYPGCKYCKKTKPYLFRHLEYLKSGEKKSKVYIFDMQPSTTEQGILNRGKFKTRPSKVTPEEKQALINEMVNKHVSTISDTYMFGVPQLYVIEKGKLVDFKPGSDSIIDYYRSLK